MKKIAIIPARSGSKGLKDKNIIDLLGKPMLVYSVEAALDAGCFERIIVSTDSERYGEISEKAGAEVIYRGEAVSNDTATTYVVLKDLFSRINMDFDYFMLLQPTSPLRDSRHILDVVDLFEKNYDTYDFLASVKESEHPKVLVNPIEADLSMKHFDTDFASYHRQAFKDYTTNGAIFVGKPKEYLEHKHFFGDKSIAYIMSPFDSVDVDSELDFKFARLCMAEKLGKYL